MSEALAMRRRFLISTCLLNAACHPVSDVAKDATPAAAYLHFEDKVAAQMLDWGIPWRIPCTKSSKEDGVGVIESLPADQCVRFSRPVRLEGLWRNEFEDQAFCAAPAKGCHPVGKWRPNQPGVAWIDFATPLAGSDDTPPGGLYAIEFIGRKTAYPGSYGEYGFYNEAVIVDRLLSIKTIDRPPSGQMTEELVARYRMDCAGKPICMPNSEVSGMK